MDRDHSNFSACWCTGIAIIPRTVLSSLYCIYQRKNRKWKKKKFLFAFISNFHIFAHGLPITTSVEVLWSLMLINGSPFTSITCGLVNPLEAIQKDYLPLWKNEYFPPRNEYFWNTIKFVGSCINLCIFISDFSYPLQLPIYVHGAIAFNICVLSWRSKFHHHTPVYVNHWFEPNP